MMTSQTKCVNGIEFGRNLVGARKPLVIPQLDEKQLEMGGPEVGSGGAPFVVSDALGAGGPPPTLDAQAPPLGMNAPVFLVAPNSPYNASNIFGMDNTHGSPAFVTICQQPAFHYQQPAPQPTASNKEVALTYKYLQQCPRVVLLAALTSVLEEFPLLCPIIRQRCENSARLLPKQAPTQQLQPQQQPTAARFAAAPQNPAPWAPQPSSGAYEVQRPAIPPAASGSPQSVGSRKGRGNKSREEGVCSIHNNVRSMNHLMLNKQKGVYECVNGFHCLEDGCCASTSLAGDNRSGPESNGETQSRSDTSFAAVGSASSLRSSQVPLLASPVNHQREELTEFVGGGLDGGLAHFRGDISLCNSGIIPCDASDLAEEGAAVEVDNGVNVLKNILQSVRLVSEMED
uniref:Uncharacterized protein TCIL3000_10_360 n=1 Tax=Trypanosoma congolense (strain IL3000) TaxID=1068625 RepID=G0UV62_TRYCI|nr:unnamed protein product [Trypanosoma congolense IL3000]